MRYIALIIALCFATTASAQWTGRWGAGIGYGEGVPTHTPGNRAGWLLQDTSTGLYYAWSKADSVWVETGTRIQFTGSTGAPTWTPGYEQARAAVNNGDSLYVYRDGAWRLLNDMPDLSGYVEWGDTLTLIATKADLDDVTVDLSGYPLRSELQDTAAAIRSDFPVNTDDQTLSLSGDTLSIEDGNSVVLPGGGGEIGSGTTNTLAMWSGDTLTNATGIIHGTTVRQTITGSGSTISTSALLVNNGNGDEIIRARDDQRFIIQGDIVAGRIGTNTSNTVFGRSSMQNLTSGYSNSAFGRNALAANTTGYSNSAFGDNALAANTTGRLNSSFGSESLDANVSGRFNAAFGALALSSSDTDGNTAFGYAAGGETTGGDNSFFGRAAGYGVTSGIFNVAIGTVALSSGGSGSNNMALGRGALFQMANGSDNVAVGAVSGWFYGSGSNILTRADEAVLIGNNTRTLQDSSVNEVVIGKSAIGHGSNTVTIGNTSVTDNYFTGSLRVNTSSTKESSSVLQANSTTAGFLPPRMTATQAEAISSPAEGLMVYSTDGSGVTITSKGWWGYDGSNWVKLN